MSEYYEVTLIFWPPTPLPGSVAQALRPLGVDFKTLTVECGQFGVCRTNDGQLALELWFSYSPHSLRDLVPALDALRVAGRSYLAWGHRKGEQVGPGFSYDPSSNTRRSFTTHGAGEPVLTGAELAALEREGSDPEALLSQVREWLRLPPRKITAVRPEHLGIVIEGPQESGPEPECDAHAKATEPSVPRSDAPGNDHPGTTANGNPLCECEHRLSGHNAAKSGDTRCLAHAPREVLGDVFDDGSDGEYAYCGCLRFTAKTQQH